MKLTKAEVERLIRAIERRLLSKRLSLTDVQSFGIKQARKLNESGAPNLAARRLLVVVSESITQLAMDGALPLEEVLDQLLEVHSGESVKI